jgi:hypothetical protein
MGLQGVGENGFAGYAGKDVSLIDSDEGEILKIPARNAAGIDGFFLECAARSLTSSAKEVAVCCLLACYFDLSSPFNRGSSAS